MVIDKLKTYHLLNNPASIGHEDAEYLKKLTKTFPYFQAAFASYLLYLKKNNEIEYKNFLPKTAAVTTDRAYLFDIVNEYEEIPVSDIPEEVQKNEKLPETAPSVSSGVKSSVINQDDIYNKQLSYLEWVKLFSESKREVRGSGRKKNKKMELIDRFLAVQPKIKPEKNYTPAPLPEAEASLRENSMLMTETLADLYVKQGKYDKAIQAFEILKLKYPEKNRYFATRILEIKSLKDRKNI
jgi:tetratricopeptide (TPR) repeat protein